MSLDWEETPKHFPEPNLQQKIGHGHCLLFAGLIHDSFLNPGKTITSEMYSQQVDEMHQKLQCLEQALVNRMGPILLHNVQLHIAQPTLQKLNELGYEVLPHLPYSWQLTSCQLNITSSSILTFLAGKILPQTAGWRKCF